MVELSLKEQDRIKRQIKTLSKKENEKLIERTFFDFCKSSGGMCVKLWPMGQIGIPDRLALLPVGIFRFVELKSPSKKPSPVQRKMHSFLRRIGFKVEVIDTMLKLQILINELKTLMTESKL